MSQGESQTRDGGLGAFDAIVSTDRLESFLDVQTALVAEAKWHVESDGIHARAVDPGNVAMYDATLAAGGFESYDADGGILGLDLNRLTEYVTSKVAGESVHLSLDPETRKLAIDVGPTAYTMALIDPESIRKEPDLPDLDLPAAFALGGATLSGAVDAAELVSDHVDIQTDGDGALTFAAAGDTDDATTELTGDDLREASTGPDPLASKVSLDYLSDIAKPIPTTDDVAVRLKLGDEFPIELSYALADEWVSVTNQLAPRISKS